MIPPLEMGAGLAHCRLTTASFSRSHLSVGHLVTSSMVESFIVLTGLSEVWISSPSSTHRGGVDAAFGGLWWGPGAVLPFSG